MGWMRLDCKTKMMKRIWETVPLDLDESGRQEAGTPRSQQIWTWPQAGPGALQSRGLQWTVDAGEASLGG